MSIDVIVTIPPYSHFVNYVAKNPIVKGLRVNTAMQIITPVEEVLEKIVKEAEGKEVWIDLKCRQIRVENFATTPYTTVEISHNIKVNLPVTAYFGDGEEEATISAINGKKLIMLDGPKRVVGPGEAINIVDDSLEIEGYFTPKDIEFIDAAKKVGIHNYMLSFVESQEDIESLKKLDPEANIVAKIESKKGIDYVKNHWDKKTRLMAARGDLYTEVGMPHNILGALEAIAKTDKNAIAASRIFPSFNDKSTVGCPEVTDIGYLHAIGYNTFMLGDQICMKKEAVGCALNLLSCIDQHYKQIN